MEKLLKIQTRLVATKDKPNDFGGFTYRSAEDILAKVKPLLAENNCFITLSDEIVEVGGWHYVKATAMFTDIEAGQSTFTTGFAREVESRKGNDAAQITGACSSYARKYALCGLLAIDDAKQDPDSNEQTKTRQKAEQAEEYAPKKVAASKLKVLQQLAQTAGVSEQTIMEEYGLAKLEDINEQQYADAVMKCGSTKEANTITEVV